MLELRQVSKIYGSGNNVVHALRDVDLRVDRGELVAVMGPSGSGKSSLLTIAGSLEEPSTGVVLVDGVSLAAMSAKARARLRRRSIGFVFQDFNLLAGLTAAENVSMPLELDGTRLAARGSSRSMHSSSFAWLIGPTTFPTICRAVNGREWPSHVPSLAIATSCSPTNRPARSTRSTARRSCVCSSMRAGEERRASS
jgi:ABC-type sugar transport system ATPase subunit